MYGQAAIGVGLGRSVGRREWKWVLARVPGQLQAIVGEGVGVTGERAVAVGQHRKA